jgi:ribA/ribD-fused uncharacterized protein
MTIPLAIEPSVGDDGISFGESAILFWGGWPSNWEPSHFTIDGVEYNCVEQRMMAAKAQLFGDRETLAKIMASPYPKAQKAFGRKVRGYDDAVWVRERYAVVLAATIEKYRQNTRLLARLLATDAGKVFGEASPYDDVWGIGFGVGDPRAFDPTAWTGQNLLGRAITEAREQLLASSPCAPSGSP